MRMEMAIIFNQTRIYSKVREGLINEEVFKYVNLKSTRLR